MNCKKCGYFDTKNLSLFGNPLCLVCASFAPIDPKTLEEYLSEKIDWKILDSFRKYNQNSKGKQKEGMAKKATEGILMTRAPLGYKVLDGKLIQNEEASRVHSLFKTFLARNYSLNSLAKNFALSTNGIKKILTNRTYLGE
ncbi:MAG: hypothetical protein NUV37_02560, partial [Nanoarchaeota archaeon]|nr:hypothetical protein [Nanoarchaeota archaeon]